MAFDKAGGLLYGTAVGALSTYLIQSHYPSQLPFEVPTYHPSITPLQFAFVDRTTFLSVSLTAVVTSILS
jgi:hypothetical protein